MGSIRGVGSGEGENVGTWVGEDGTLVGNTVGAGEGLIVGTLVGT